MSERGRIVARRQSANECDGEVAGGGGVEMRDGARGGAGENTCAA